jgi:hypothetical protein
MAVTTSPERSTVFGSAAGTSITTPSARQVDHPS